MLLIFLVIGFLVLWAYVPHFRIAVINPLKTLFYSCKDVFLYFKRHEYDFYEGGKLDCYCAHFGGGKTLSIVHRVKSLFRRYNNKYVWDRGRGCFVLQKVHVISNVTLNGIPFEYLTELKQIVDCADFNKRIDEKNGTRTCVLVVIDEASAQLNSRSWGVNFSWDFLNTLLTSRHFAISVFYSSQKFKLTDALLRSVTQRCILCHKWWRLVVQYVYNADELELASDASLIKPLFVTGYFVTDNDYNSYDTLATVDKLRKDIQSGQVRSMEEIMALRQGMNPDNDSIVNPSRKLKRLRKGKTGK